MNYSLKQLNRAYIKRFNQINKNMLTVNGSGLLMFVEYLKYLRDVSILTQKPSETITTITIAIEEFEAFNKNQKEFHWNSFCEFTKLNMKEWLAVNDSV